MTLATYSVAGWIDHALPAPEPSLTIVGSRHWTRSQRRAAWKQFDAFARTFEPTLHYHATDLLIDMQASIVADTWEILEEDGKGATEDSVRAWQRQMGVHKKRYHRQWRNRFRELTEHQVEVVGGIVAGEMGFSFDIYGPEIAAFMTTRPNLLAGGVTDSTFRGLLATIEEGMREGESTAMLARRVERTFTQGLTIRDKRGRIRILSSRQRARLIARTEATAITNGAARRSVLGSGLLTDKEWLTQGDDRVRDDHIAMEGEIVPTEEPFSNGLDEPSEPNCRCTLIFHTRRPGRSLTDPGRYLQ